MLWARETEGRSFDTPERRAALEARINEVTAAIGDDAVRKYYRQDFNARLAQFFAPAQGAARGPRANWRQGGRGRGREIGRANGASAASAATGRRATAHAPARRARPAPYVVVSNQIAASPVHRGHRTAVPRREALILQAALNHPWLLHDHLEELSHLEFRHTEAERLKGALIDIAAHSAACRPLDAASPAGRTRRPRARRDCRAHRRRHHHALGLGRAARRPRPTTCWLPGSSSSPCIASGIPYLRSSRTPSRRWARTPAKPITYGCVTSRRGWPGWTGTEALIEGFGASSGRGARSL